MLFIPLLLFGIGLYFTKWRVWSGVIFFFFTSYGFQFIPESLFDMGIISTRSTDFAVVYVLAVFLIAYFRYNDFVVRNKMSVMILLFLAFVITSIFYSRYHLGVTLADALKTSRYYFLVLGYFIFRRFTKEEMLYLLRILFFLTLVGCSLYVIQSFTGFSLLAGGWRGRFGVLNRYFNIPILYYLLVASAFFCNPYKGFWKYYSIVIFCVVAVVSQHRSLMMAIFVASIIGVYIAEGGFKGVFKYFLIGGLLLLPLLNVVLDRFGSDTSSDIRSVVEGELGDNVEEITSSGTLVFRVGVLAERWMYVIEKPERIIMGVGLMLEGSDKANEEFDFYIGLTDEVTGKIAQLNTSDMTWIVFLLRLGFAGTILFLSLYFLMGKFFFKHRKNKLALAFFVYIIIALITSLSSIIMADVALMVPMLMVYGVMEMNMEKEEDLHEIAE